MLTALSVNHGGLGRFGNQLWTIAGTIGTAIKNGQPYAFPKWINQDNALFGGNADDMSQYFVNPLPVLPEELIFETIPYWWGYKELNLPTGNYNLHGHMQSDKYWLHCADVIREMFRMKDEPEQNDYVAIHYRAGDYTEGADGHHPRCSKGYYEKAMAMFPKGTKFILFSDGMVSWVDMMGGLGEVEVHRKSASYIEDFKLMKRCRHFITANSSFSSMAAALGEAPDKIVIQPKFWFGKSMPDGFGTEDIYLQNAIVI